MDSKKDWPIKKLVCLLDRRSELVSVRQLPYQVSGRALHRKFRVCLHGSYLQVLSVVAFCAVAQKLWHDWQATAVVPALQCMARHQSRHFLGLWLRSLQQRGRQATLLARQCLIYA